MIDKEFFGETSLRCIYDAVILLSMVDDYIGIDQNSEAFKTLHELVGRFWECFDDVTTMTI